MNRAPPSGAWPASTRTAEPGDQAANDRQTEAGPDLPYAPVALVEHPVVEGDRADRRRTARVRRRGPRARPVPARHDAPPSTIGAPLGVTRRALSNSPSSTWRTRAASVTTWIGCVRSVQVEQHAGARHTRADQTCAAPCTIPTRSTGARSIRKSGASRRARSSRSPTSRSSRFASPSITRADVGGLVGRHDVVGQRLGVAGDRGERGAQVVRDRQQELALPSLGVAQRAGERVDRIADLDDLGRALRGQGDVAVAGGERVRGGRRATQRAGHPPGDEQPDHRGQRARDQQRPDQSADGCVVRRDRVRPALDHDDAAANRSGRPSTNTVRVRRRRGWRARPAGPGPR